MDKRTWLAIGVFALFLLGYQWWLSTRAPKPSQKPQPTETVSAAPETARVKVSEPAETIPPPPDTAFITVETENFIAKITRRGGVLASLTLKGFKGPDGKALELVREPGLFRSPEDTALLSEAQPYIRVQPGQRLSVEFMGGGHRKVYTFEGLGYAITFKSNLNKIYLWGPYLTERDRGQDLRSSAALWRAEKLHKLGLGKLKKEPKALGNPSWFGFRNHYFLWAFTPSEPVKFVELKALSDSLARAKVLADSVSLVAYLGPIDPKVLPDYGLGEVFSWGFFLITPITKAIYWMFVHLGRVIPNYGWVIVIFALLMKIAFFPLSVRTYRSMSKMQALKPKLEEIQRKYKDDPQKLQEATLKLYQTYGVNPFSGCFPMLLQLPIFWALYQVLRNAIEFRMAPWILWIQDLSYKDPYYVLPLVMGAVSILNTFFQPGVDRQARMTSMLMAGLFVFIFLNLPAGIVLYWLTYNLYTTVEQAVIRAGGRRWST